MALIKDGWWQDTWWPSRWWQEDYWLEYGVAAPPPVAPTAQGVFAPRPKLPSQFIRLIRDYVESLEN